MYKFFKGSETMNSIKNPDFIIEKMPDLTINEIENPLATKFRHEVIRYSSDNIILENGQMIVIDLTKDIQDKVIEYNMEIFFNILRSEKLIVECANIIENYKMTGNNNSISFMKNCFDIIIYMDQAYKYIWNICKLLNDGVDSYNDYIEWQKGKIDVDPTIYNNWSTIYHIRNEIEHPSNSLSPTFLTKIKNIVVTPTITYNNKKYDMLNLAKSSIEILYTFAHLIIGASFLYSKYIVIFTDESRTKIFPINFEMEDF